MKVSHFLNMKKKIRVGKNRIIYINNPTLSLGIPQLGWSANSLPPRVTPTHTSTQTHCSPIVGKS